MTRVTRATVERTCAICERTLLLGERPARYSPNGGGQYVDVCPLCQETAVEHGWIREGAPTTPTVSIEGARKRGSGLLAAIMGTRVRADEAPIASEPILRRLSDRELALVEAADLFNASQYRRTVGGISKSLGEPQVSIVVLSGRNPEMVLTVAWDISWYQYRVAPESDNPVRLEDRGHEPSELQATFTDWNAHIDDDGRVVPDLARV